MQEEDIRNFMQQEWVMTSSDGGSPHPRKYASYPRKIEKFVPEDEVLSLPQMIRRSTSLPARTLGLYDRGLLQVGKKADVIIFDPQAIQVNSTYENPAQLSTGMSWVIVNGQVVIEQGAYLGVLAGKYQESSIKCKCQVFALALDTCA